MSAVSGIKEQLHRQIDTIDDENALEILEEVVLSLSSANEQGEIPAHVRAGIQRGIDDVEAGRVFTDEQARQIANEWLKS